MEFANATCDDIVHKSHYDGNGTYVENRTYVGNGTMVSSPCGSRISDGFHKREVTMVGKPSEDIAIRNREIVTLYLQGVTNKELAAKYYLSTRTIDMIVKQAKDKREAKINKWILQGHKNKTIREKFNLTPNQLLYRKKKLQQHDNK